MEAPQASEPFGAHSCALEIWQDNAPGVANDDELHISASVYEDANLSIDFTRDFGEMARKLLSHDLAGMNAPLVKLFQAVDLARLEALQVPFDIYGSLLRICRLKPKS